MTRIAWLATAIVLPLTINLAQADPLGTAFTYQGQLQQADRSANGDYDFQFVLFNSDDFVTGIDVAGPVTIPDHPVAEGLFSVEIDFGADVFGSDDVWLEVRVREGASDGPFTTLAPREKITPVPRALYAASVDQGAIGSEQLSPDAVGSNQIADASILAIDVDDSQVQLRIDATCTVGSSIRAINSDGTVVCEPDSDSGGDITGVQSGAGLTGGAEVGTATLAIDFNQAQARLTGSCPPGQYLAGIAMDGSPSCVRVSPVVLTTRISNNINEDRWSDIAIGSGGLPIVALSDPLDDGIWVAVCAEHGCTSGNHTFNLIEDSARVLSRPKIAIGEDGNPVISYVDEGNGALIVAKCSDPVCAASPMISTAHSTTQLIQSQELTIGSDGFPVIAYVQFEAGPIPRDIVIVHCNDAACTGGNEETYAFVEIGTGPFVGNIVVADGGFPMFSYSNLQPYVVHCNDLSCAGGDDTGSRLDLVNYDMFNTPVAMTVGNDGLPVVAFIGANIDQGLYVARCDDFFCTGQNETATWIEANELRSGRDPAIAIGNDGLPIIALEIQGAEGDRGLRIVHCNDPACAEADEVIIDEFGPVNFGFDPSIAIGSDGLPVIVHHVPSNGDIYVTHCSTISCQ